MDSYDEMFHVVSLSDDRAKLLAMELANDKGRMVLEKIFEGKKSSSEIAKELDMGLPTVLFHIERLKEAGLIKIIDTNLSKKFREIKYYGPSKQAILILPPSAEGMDMRPPSSVKISGKIAGAASLVGAGMAAILLSGFSKKVVLPPTESLILSAPDAVQKTDYGTREVSEVVRQLPSLGETAGIVVLSAVVALALVLGVRHLLGLAKARRNGEPPESQDPAV
ncbi:MAG: winged helix-turn-helix domain-containing protein [Candidatus Methanofastidiosa archaeon]|jgi:DNA-binding Lrp family transcriptional regulator|nr:winged helix-turn-helix domain-containing protein [Candidatus Methanofastidiosa archaeon]